MTKSFEEGVGIKEGAQGSTGAQGPQGFQGSQGNQGTQGSQGNQGAAGSAASNAGVVNWKAWTFDPSTYSSNTVFGPTLGVGYYQAVYLTAGTVITNFLWPVATSAGTTTLYYGLYNSTGMVSNGATLINGSYSSSSATPNTTAVLAFATTYTVPTSGQYWIGILCVGGTTLNFWRNIPTTGLTNLNSGPVANTLTMRASTLGSGLTALPTSISGTPTSTTQVFLLGLL
jgi:hypothetical protein